MDPEGNNSEDRGRRGEDHGEGVVDAEDGNILGGRQVDHDGHQEDNHVKHGGDTEGDLLAGLGRDEEDKKGKDVDEDRGLGSNFKCCRLSCRKTQRQL